MGLKQRRNRYCKNCGELIKRVATKPSTKYFCSSICRMKYWNYLRNEKKRLKREFFKINDEMEEIKDGGKRRK